MTPAAVRRRRVERSHLARPAPAGGLVDSVAGVCGVQAQDPAAAALAVGVRVDAVTREDVRAALFDDRTLVRTWALRGTMHLLPAAELSLWMAALSVTPHWTDEAWLARNGLTTESTEHLLAAIGDALSGRELLREELADEVGARLGSGVRERLMSGWGELLAPATRAGLLCHGPGRAGKATFVRADEWIGGWVPHDPREALAEVFRRFLTTYGPATVRDFEKWSGAGLPADVRDRVDTAEVVVGRRRCLVVAGDDVSADEVADEVAGDDVAESGAAAPVRLLPRYDCYLLGSYPREDAVPKEHSARLRGHPRGRFEGAVGHSTLLVDGVVAGVWERRDDVVRVEPYVDLTPAELAALEEAAARVGAFHETEATLSLGPI